MTRSLFLPFAFGNPDQPVQHDGYQDIGSNVDKEQPKIPPPVGILNVESTQKVVCRCERTISADLRCALVQNIPNRTRDKLRQVHSTARHTWQDHFNKLSSRTYHLVVCDGYAQHPFDEISEWDDPKRKDP